MVEVDGSGLVKNDDDEVRDVWTELDAINGAIDHARSCRGVLDTFRPTQKFLGPIDKFIKTLEKRQGELNTELNRIRAERGLRPRGVTPQAGA